MSKIVFVSAGLRDPKKTEHPFARLHLYLNYGLLGLATIAKEAGLDAGVFHGNFSSVSEFLARENVKSAIASTGFPIFLSLPSSKSIPWASEFLAFVRSTRPELKVVVGGRWVLGEDVRWLRVCLPEVDLFVYGTAEGRIVDLLYPERWSRIPYTERTFPGTSPEIPPRHLPELDYAILDGYQDYTSSLEVSRGCGMGCSFCLEKDSPLSSLRSPENVAANLIRYRSVWDENITPYFECSFFRPPSRWITQFAEIYKAEGLSIRWRTETRVDSIAPSQVSALAAAGLRVVDLGLESASPRQLKAMQKTSRPDVYLKKAGELLSALADEGVWAKVNVLLYAGETEDTLAETLEWLEARRPKIKGVSVNPLVVYRTGSGTEAYLSELATMGASPASRDDLAKWGYSEMHLSPAFDRTASLARSLAISRSFMTARDYFDLKSFSYFPRSLSWEKFSAICRSASEELPFSGI